MNRELAIETISKEEVLRAIITCDTVGSSLIHLYDVIENMEPSITPTVKVRQVDTLIIAAALQDFAQNSERNISDRERAEELREQVLAYGASMCYDTPTVSEDMGEVSDGYHTFNQLYHQRAVLFATIVNQNKDKAWKSWKHEDGQFCFDKGGEWFIVGVDTPKGSYTYHYEKKYWDMFDCEELDRGKHWDGHTEEDVTRLLSLPPVTPTVSEDCISRQAAIKYINDYAHMFTTGNYFEGMMNAVDLLKRLDLFPPVTPTERTGEWKRHPIHDNRAWDVCTACGIGCRRRHYGFNEDGTEWVEEVNYPFCPNCGAKMKGGTENE